MKRFTHTFFIVLFITLIVFNTVQAQNLVPNPSFEEMIYCPQQVDQFDACADWYSGWQPFTTPNFFTPCSNNPDVTPPVVIWGYQMPHDGDSYSFVETYETFGDALREVIQATLIGPLVIGQAYFVSFYSSFPGLGANQIATNKLGALFTTYPFTAVNYSYPHNFAQVYTDSVLIDTISWFHIQGSFVADSAFQYIAIGNFFDDEHTDTLVQPGGLLIGGGYFIDDVCVTADSTNCSIPNEIQELHTSDFDFSISANPASTTITLSLPSNQNAMLSIFNLLGEKVKEEKVTGKQVTMDVSSLPQGLYLVRMENRVVGKFAKE